QKRSLFPFQFNDDRIISVCSDRIYDMAFITFESAEHGVIIRELFRITVRPAFKVLYDRIRIEIRTIMEFNAFLQLECIRQTVIRIPLFRESRLNSRIFLTEI